MTTRALPEAERDRFLGRLAQVEEHNRRLFEQVVELGAEPCLQLPRCQVIVADDPQRAVLHLEAELRVAADAIAEHVRQKAALRDRIDVLTRENTGMKISAHHATKREARNAQTLPPSVRARLDELPAKIERLARAAIDGALGLGTLEASDAGRGGRAAGERGDARADTADARVGLPPADADRLVAATDAVVGTGDAEQPAGGVAMERAVSAAAAPVDAPADAEVVPGEHRKRSTEGWFFQALVRLGRDATAAQVAGFDRRTVVAAGQAARIALAKGLIKPVGKLGKAVIYRPKATTG